MDPYKSRIQAVQPSEIRRLLKYANAPGWISFGGGFPDETTFFMKDKLQPIIEKIKNEGHLEKALQYASSQGVKSFRAALSEKYFPAMGIDIKPDEIVVSVGAQQILSGLGKIFSPDKVMITSNPTYVGAIPAFRQKGAKIAGVDMDTDGMRSDLLKKKIEELGAENINFIYCIPNFQNPAGIQMSEKRRNEILDISWEYNIPLVEDDPYPMMYFPGKSMPPSIMAIEQKRIKENKLERFPLVTYIGTSSKTFGGGFRTGWMAGPMQLVPNQAAWIGIECLHATSTTQYIIGKYLEENGYEGMVRDTELSRNRYHKKILHMTKCFDEIMGKDIEYHMPDGGLFLWIKIPGANTKEMLDLATNFVEAYEAGKVNMKINNIDDLKIVYVPGWAFAAEDPKSTQEFIRVTYANSDFDEIKEGVMRLRNCLAFYRDWKAGKVPFKL